VGKISRLVLFLFALFALAPVPAAAAPITTMQAALQHARLAVPALPGGAIFGSPQPLATGTTIAVNAPGLPKLSMRTVVRLAAPAWLFFVDLRPNARFEHPTKFVLVRASDGATTVYSQSWWPIVNGADRWTAKTERARDLVYRDSSHPPGGGGAGVSMNANMGDVPSYCTASAIRKYALLISAGDDAAVDPSETDNLALLLHSKGYSNQQIQPSSLDQGWQTVSKRLAELNAQLLASFNHGYCAEVLIVWAGHGSSNGYVVVQRASGRKDIVPLRTVLQTIENTSKNIEGLQLRVIMDTCYSGQVVPLAQQIMPVDVHTTGVNKIARDIVVIGSASASQPANGSSLTTTSYTQAFADCIKSGSATASAFNCAAQKVSGNQSPIGSHWWNDGS